MQVYADKIEEYKFRHNPIWDELKATLKKHGVYNYSIFFDAETCFLFGYVEIESDNRWNEIADTDVCKKWWLSMRELMDSNPDNSPVSMPLEEVFHMD